MGTGRGAAISEKRNFYRSKICGKANMCKVNLNEKWFTLRLLIYKTRMTE